MKNKKSRLQQIVELINNNCIGSQEELSKMLSTKGFMVTQATLSRDLKMLRITKVATDTGKLLQSGQMIQKNHSASFVSINFSHNIAVIKTRNGYASGLAYDIDMSKTPEILGTIAGADTVFAILREDVTHEQALQVFAKFLPITIEPI